MQSSSPDTGDINHSSYQIPFALVDNEPIAKELNIAIRITRDEIDALSSLASETRIAAGFYIGKDSRLAAQYISEFRSIPPEMRALTGLLQELEGGHRLAIHNCLDVVGPEVIFFNKIASTFEEARPLLEQINDLLKKQNPNNAQRCIDLIRELQDTFPSRLIDAYIRFIAQAYKTYLSSSRPV